MFGLLQRIKKPPPAATADPTTDADRRHWQADEAAQPTKVVSGPPHHTGSGLGDTGSGLGSAGLGRLANPGFEHLKQLYSQHRPDSMPVRHVAKPAPRPDHDVYTARHINNEEGNPYSVGNALCGNILGSFKEHNCTHKFLDSAGTAPHRTAPLLTSPPSAPPFQRRAGILRCCHFQLYGEEYKEQIDKLKLHRTTFLGLGCKERSKAVYQAMAVEATNGGAASMVPGAVCLSCPGLAWPGLAWPGLAWIWIWSGLV